MPMTLARHASRSLAQRCRLIANAQACETGKFILCRPARVSYETTALVNRLSSSRPPGPTAGGTRDRKSVGEGKSVSVRVDPGGRRIIKKQKINIKQHITP